MRLWTPWLRSVAGKVGWILLGTLLVLAVFWCRRQYAKEVAFRMYAAACEQNPADLDAVDRTFARAANAVIPISDGMWIGRYRFCGSEDIDVIYDKNGRVVRIFPTYTQDGFGLTLLLHRDRLTSVRVNFTVPQAVPVNTE